MQSEHAVSGKLAKKNAVKTDPAVLNYWMAWCALQVRASRGGHRLCHPRAIPLPMSISKSTALSSQPMTHHGWLEKRYVGDVL